MRFPGNALAILIAAGLAACERPAPEKPEIAPASTPEPGYAGTAQVSPAPAASTPASEPPRAVEAPDEVNTDAHNAENRLVKAEVLSRIDLMPSLTPEEKDKLYVQVERARGMGKIITIPFSSGKTTVGSAEAASLQEKIKLPQLQKFADDPTVIFVVLGFADKKGDQKKNLALSLERANSVVDALKQRGGVMNLVHAVGMGSSEMFDSQNLEKNRVVEIWAVLP